jgi:hypothetical protein
MRGRVFRFGGEAHVLRATAGIGADSGPSRGDPCLSAFRPTEASKAAARYVRSTSIPDLVLSH